MYSASTTGPRGTRPRLHEQLVEALCQQIETGQLNANDRLTEESIAERFNVSRGTVRRAFQQLVDRGLLNLNTPRGVVIAPTAVTRRATKPVDTNEVLDTKASWEAIYDDVAHTAVVHAVYGEWRVVEAEMAKHYGVSRTIAREVLARLEQRGVLHKHGSTRWRLPMLTAKRLADLYEMRRLIEPVALRQAAGRVPLELLHGMQEELRLACNRKSSFDADAYEHLERRLHVDLLAFANNEIMKDVLRGFHALLFTNTALYRNVGQFFGTEPFPTEHLFIVEALINGDTVLATSHLSDHLAISLTRAMERVEYARKNVKLDQSNYMRK